MDHLYLNNLIIIGFAALLNQYTLGINDSYSWIWFTAVKAITKRRYPWTICWGGKL